MAFLEVAAPGWQDTIGEKCFETSPSRPQQSQCQNETSKEEEERNNSVIFVRHRENLTSKDGFVRPTPVRSIPARSQENRLEEKGSYWDSVAEATLSRPKRVLSSHQLQQLSTSEVGGTSQTKRIRSMSMDEIFTVDTVGAVVESDKSLDVRLGEELNSQDEESVQSEAGTRSPERNSPECVPLLTPPQSPRPSIVEWPSNLVIDSALMALDTDARPLSPASLMEESPDIAEKAKAVGSVPYIIIFQEYDPPRFLRHFYLIRTHSWVQQLKHNGCLIVGPFHLQMMGTYSVTQSIHGQKNSNFRIPLGCVRSSYAKSRVKLSQRANLSAV
eukprot:scaffold12372_cov103-Cylindrotheca_fusiformis.AAC.1